MKKTLKLSLLASLLAVAGIASAQSNTVTNEGRIMSSTQVFASVNGNGGSLSHAETRTGATANGSIGAPSAGNASLTGDIAGYSNITAYNTAFGSGVGTAGGRTWSDARVFGDIGVHIPTGNGAIALDVEGGMRDPGRNGSDVTVQATTRQDGFANGMYNGGATVSIAMASGPSNGSTSVQGNVQSTSYQHGEVVAGGVTFNGGTPDGQSAAVRFGQSGVQVTTDGWFHDPAH